MNQNNNEDKELIALFNDELSDLRDNLREMSQLILNTLEQAIQSLINKDQQLAQQHQFHAL